MAAQYIHGTDPTEQERLAKLNSMTNDAFISYLDVRPSDQVLEIGSGLGILAEAVARKASNGYAVGVEYSPQQLAKVHTTAENLRFVRGDGHKLPFADATFDLVYCRYLLEHVGEPGEVVREAHRVLKPGGRFCTQENNILINAFWPDCPTFNFVWEQFAVLQTQLGGDALIGKKLFPLLKRAGFERVELSLHPEVHWAGTEYYTLWVENLIGVAETGRSEMVARRLATNAQCDIAFAELRELVANPEGTALFYWNRAKGWK